MAKRGWPWGEMPTPGRLLPRAEPASCARRSSRQSLVLRGPEFRPASAINTRGQRLCPTRRGQSMLDAFSEWQQWTPASFLA